MAMIKKSATGQKDGKDTPNAKPAATVNPGDGAVMSKWNNYLSWLQQKGKKGSSELDKDGVGVNMLNQYNSEMKSNDKAFSPITTDDVGKIQEYLKDYRSWAMSEIKQGKGEVRLASTGTAMPYSKMNEAQKQEFESSFMSPIKTYENQGKEWVDKYPGQFTTSVTFPSSYMTLIDQGVRNPTQNVGFAAAEMSRGKQITSTTVKQPAKGKTNMITKKK
jgi:hypothetical protein